MSPLTTLLGMFAALQGFAAPPGAPVAPPVPTLPHALVAERPASLVGREVQLVFQFHSLEETWNPFVTRFAPRRWLAVRGWADEQLPWVEADYGHRPVRVFVARGTFLEDFFRLGQRHERIAATCVVREVFAGRPWIEVLAAEATPESIPEGTVLHAERALEVEAHGAWGLALGELERALAAPLPAHARRELLEVQRRCREARDKR